MHYIVACQGSGVSSKPTILWMDKTTRPFSPLKRWTIPYKGDPYGLKGWLGHCLCAWEAGFTEDSGSLACDDMFIAWTSKILKCKTLSKRFELLCYCIIQFFLTPIFSTKTYFPNLNVLAYTEWHYWQNMSEYLNWSFWTYHATEEMTGLWPWIQLSWLFNAEYVITLIQYFGEVWNILYYWKAVC